MPIFIRLSGLVPLLTDRKMNAGRVNDRTWILDLLEARCKDLPDAPHQNQWNELLESGEALLLLDGLDEVGDETLRNRVFDIFRDACEHWRKCRIVVSSRPIQTEALEEMGFHCTTIEAFGRELGIALVTRSIRIVTHVLTQTLASLCRTWMRIPDALRAAWRLMFSPALRLPERRLSSAK